MRNLKLLPIFAAIVLALIAVRVHSQTAPRTGFEVATLKAVAPLQTGEQYPVNLGSARNGRVTLANTTLSDCIRFAYGMVSDDQISGPDWIKSREVRFDIVGQAPPDTSQDQLLVMLQELLADRLKLVLHREQKPMSFMALLVAKNGPKLREAKDNADGAGSQVIGRIVHPRMPMAVLAGLISRFERQIVADMTNLTGPFDVNLTWTPEALRGRAGEGGGAVVVNGQSIDTNGPSLVTALQEQLGLRLESRRGPLDVLIVDSAEKVPTDN